MKNIHLLPTDKPSRLFLSKTSDKLLFLKNETRIDTASIGLYQNIYITNSEEIKEGDWYLGFETNYSTEPKERWVLYNCVSKPNGDYSEKIILTTDQDLIKDGVQEIDDEFLEWFVKNPSCEEVEIGEGVRYEDEWIDNEDGGEIFQHQYCCYKISIPKEEPKQIKCYCGHTSYCDCSPLEEPKQETLEEAAESRFGTDMDSIRGGKVYDLNTDLKRGFVAGAKWQQERSYSEEDMIKFAEFVTTYPDKNRNVNGEILHAKSKYDGAERTIDLLEQFKKK